MNKTPTRQEIRLSPPATSTLPPDEGEITLQKIAEALGVSCTTVCRALKNHPRISQATTRRVEMMAKKMGYRRDAHLTDLMTHLRRRRKVTDRPVLAFLLWQHIPVDPRIFQQKDTIFGGLWRRAWESGYQPELFNLAEYESNCQRLTRVLWSRGIRGAILCPIEHPSRLPDIPWDRLSVVAIGHSIYSGQLHRCVSNLYQGMLDCIERLQGLGYQRIGTVISPSIDARTQRYAHAAYLVTRDAAKPGQLVPALMAAPDNQDALPTWWKKWKPEAVICAGSTGLVQSGVARLGLTIPGDVGLADLQVPGPNGLSGIHQNSCEVGVAAVDLLVSLLQNNQTGLPEIPRTILVNGRWVEGTTTRSIRTQTKTQTL